ATTPAPSPSPRRRGFLVAQFREPLLQLDRVPSHPFPQDDGTRPDPAGVGAEAEAPGPAPWPRPSRRPAWKKWAAIALGCCGLLGQGERCHVDPRLHSPGTTLAT